MRWPTRYLAILTGLVILPSCALFKRSGSISTPAGTVVGVADAGKPATLDSDRQVDTIILPAGTSVTTVKETALAAIPATASQPAQPAKPERETTTFVLPSPAQWVKTDTRLSANTGTVDTSIAKAKIDAEESRVLLYASIGAAVIAGFFVYRAYPTPALISGVASVVFFLAWKASGLPEWFSAVGAIALAGAAFLYIGHSRGLSESLKTPQNDPSKS